MRLLLAPDAHTPPAVKPDTDQPDKSLTVSGSWSRVRQASRRRLGAGGDRGDERVGPGFCPAPVVGALDACDDDAFATVPEAFDALASSLRRVAAPPASLGGAGRAARTRLCAQARQLLSLPTCPEDVFVADGKTSIFVPHNDALQEIQFGSQVRVKAPIPLPKIDPEKHKFKVKNQALAAYIKQYTKWLKPVAAGYLNHNKIGIAMRIGLPADDSYNFLYALQDGAWVLLDKKYCGRFDTCKFESLNGRGSGVWDWKRERRVWHPRHTANRYVIDRQFLRDSDVEFNSGKGTLTFGINGRTSILTFFIDPGPDTGATLTFGITLQVAGQSLAKLPGQCETSLAHKYLLFDRFWVGQTLIDLETGERVLGELKLATWIN